MFYEVKLRSVGVVIVALGLAAGQGLAQKDEGLRRTVAITGMSRSFLGVGVVEVSAERAKTLKLQETYGVEVTRVDEDSPAAKAGVAAQDVVESFNGEKVLGVEQFIRLVRETPPGREIKLGVNRDGRRITVPVQIESRRMRMVEVGDMHVALPAPPAIPEIPMPPRPAGFRTGALGIEVEALRDQLADFFGVKEGVLVRQVSRDSAADRAGMRAGDVITAVGDKQVSTPVEVTRALTGAPDTNVTVTVMRNRKQVPLAVKLDDDSQPARIRGRSVRLPQEE
jgi:serine protease Do